VFLNEVPGIGEFDAVPGADLEAGVCAGAYGVEDGNQVIPVLVELANLFLLWATLNVVSHRAPHISPLSLV
jgi:hypothetical protein